MIGTQLTLVCFAVKEEAKFFKAFAAFRPELRILLTGMGRRNAEQAIRQVLKSAAPGLVLSAGFAGGLRPGLPTGTVVFANDNAAGLESALLAAGAQRARFHCVERVAGNAAEKRGLWQSTGADAVEMESEVIGEICREQGIASATIRVILDAAEEDLPLDFNRLMTEDLRLDSRKLALELARSPGKIRALLRLRRQSDDAARKLAEVLQRAIG